MEPGWNNWNGQGNRQRYQDLRSSQYNSPKPEDYPPPHSSYPQVPIIPQPQYVGPPYSQQEISPAFPVTATPTQYTSQHPHQHAKYPSHPSSYLAPEYGSPYHISLHHSGAHSPALSSYASSTHADTPSPSPQSDFQGENQPMGRLDPEIVHAFYPDGISSEPRLHAGPSETSSSSANRFQQQMAYHVCDHPGCNRVCPRLCDLRKHKKRHQKPFPCREGEACGSYFSTEKDRDRHERSKHRVEERLTCAVCGHRTARKDNMKDHVRRRHGEEDLERIMDITMGMPPPTG